jgi:hypothetical protein
MKISQNIDLELGELVCLWQLLLTERKRMDEKIEAHPIPLESSIEKRDELTALFHKVNNTITQMLD